MKMTARLLSMMHGPMKTDWNTAKSHYDCVLNAFK